MKKVILSTCSALFGLLAQTTLAQSTFSVMVSTSPSCDSLCTGTATLYFYTSPPVTYSVYGAYTYTSGSTSNTFAVVNNLCAGTYSVLAVDGMGGLGSSGFSVGQILAPSISSVTYAPSVPPMPYLYTATASISGGNPPYYVTWMGYMGNPTKTHTVSSPIDTAYLYPGDYTVTVTDSINTVNGCPGNNNNVYMFSICDPGVGGGIISISPNDTVCQGTTYTVQYFPLPYGPVNIVNAYVYADSTANCMPMSSTNPYAVITCTATQNTSFYGYWWYANGCAPVMYQPASIVVMNCTDVKSVNILPENVLIYPNPSDGYLKFHFNKKTDELIEAEITDITGKLLIKKAVAPDKEEYFDLPQGIYYLKISSKEYSRVQRLVIIK